MKETAKSYLSTTLPQRRRPYPRVLRRLPASGAADVGTVSGMNVLRIIKEPTSVAVAGGTFDVSLMAVEDGIFEVKATADKTCLSSDDFENHFAICRPTFWLSLVSAQLELCLDLYRSPLKPDEKVLQNLKKNQANVHESEPNKRIKSDEAAAMGLPNTPKLHVSFNSLGMLLEGSTHHAGAIHDDELNAAVAVIKEIIQTDSTGATAQTLEPIILGLQQHSGSSAPVYLDNSGGCGTNPPLMYGMPLAGVEPIEPQIGEFRWDTGEYVSPEGDDRIQEHYDPSPSQTPPTNCWYPLAPTFHLEKNPDYRRGKALWSNFYTADKPLIRRRALCTINPPDIDASFDENGIFIEKPLPGMTRMILGIPYIQRVDGNPRHTVTVAVAQTSESLKRFGNGISAEVKVLEEELYLLAFGSNPMHQGADSIVALYSLGLKRNDRSSKPAPGSNSNDGSYSLASTVEKGQGQGCFQPAVQNSTPLARKLIRRTLDIVHKLQQLIMPCCLSKFEWEATRFIAEYNNVFVFGGLGPGATGLQMNVSSGVGELKLSIGGVQGDWHTDFHDDDGHWTMAIMILKLPPGSDPGPFMLGRFGLYIRETNVLIIYLVFRGNDLHSGYHPAYLPSSHKAWIDKEAIISAYDLCAPEQRIVLVPYATGVGVNRTAEVAVTPPLTFMNLGAPVPHKLHTQNFSQHGETILGSSHARHSRLSREIIWGMLNALDYAGISLDMTPSELFKKLKYKNEEGELCVVEPPPFDLTQSEDVGKVMRMRGLFAWHRQLSRKFLVPISKDMYRTVQACIRFRRHLEAEMFVSMERHTIQHQSSLPQGSPARVIEEVIGREIIAGQVAWKVRVQDCNNPITVSEKETVWLYQTPNREKMQGFIQRHIPLTSPALRKLYAKMIAGEASSPALSESPVGTSNDLGEQGRETLAAADHHTSGDVETGMTDGRSPLFLPGDDDSDLSEIPDDLILSEENTWENDRPGEMEVDAENGGQQDIQATSVDVDVDTTNVDTQPSSNEGQLPLCAEEHAGAGADQSGGREGSIEGSANKSFEIAGIVGYAEDKVEGQMWRVRWKGFDETHDSWLDAKAFTDAKDIFKDYNRRNKITVADITSKSKRKRRRSTKEDLAEGEPSSEDPKLLVRTEQFLALLSSSTLEQEMESLRRLSSASGNIHLVNPAMLLTHMGELNMTNTWMASYLQYDSLSNDSSFIRILQVQEAIGQSGVLLHGLEQVSILRHAIQWEMGRILLMVYEWLTDTAPALVDALFLAHIRGPTVLNAQFHNFARLTEHVMLYTEHCKAKQKPLSRPTKKRRKAVTVTEPEQDSTTPSAGSDVAPTSSSWPPSELDKVPANLYGLREVTENAKPLHMPAITRHIYDTAESFEKEAKSCLFNILCRELVWIPMVTIDQKLSGTKRRAYGHDAVHARLISRGAILQCIVDACGEGILACDALFPVLTTPTALFPSNLSSDQRLMMAVRSKGEGVLQPLRDALAETLERDPDIPFYAEEVARITHHRTLELQHRRVLTPEQVLTPHALPPSQRPSVPGTKRNGRRLNRVPVVNLSVSQLIDPSDMLGFFSLPAVILRETLNKMKGGAAIDEPLRRILDGKDPSTGTNSRSNLDHVNPVRVASTNLQLLKQHIPPSKATTDLGLSNLVVWMITGQGYSTSKFLSQHPERFFFFNDAEECINHFREAQDANASIIADYLRNHPRATFATLKTLPNYMILDDVNVWGQASNELGLNPTIRGSGGRRATLEDKLTDPFCPTKVRSMWKEWLGEMYGQDPQVYSGPRHTWKEAIVLIQSLGINGVKGDGLTTLQLANNLVFLSICHEPTSAELGEWISHNPKLGAYKGLCLLRFKLAELDPIAIQVAFQIVYGHLDRWMTASDKEYFGFGAIFVEHLLCKVKRWMERYNAMPTDLLKWAKAHVSGKRWVQGSNITDPASFPFPNDVNEEWVQQVIQDVLDLRD
ncbi:hypothetical protein B0H12DRAFT_1239877 [Mycena haematopus]|nr:hypothetical protein B0H12DRAFT_1239877 [Mycena haematopus]